MGVGTEVGVTEGLGATTEGLDATAEGLDDTAKEALDITVDEGLNETAGGLDATGVVAAEGVTVRECVDGIEGLVMVEGVGVLFVACTIEVADIAICDAALGLFARIVCCNTVVPPDAGAAE